MTDETEEWREIPGFSNYAASSLGRIKRVAPDTRGCGGGNILKQSKNDKGYRVVTFYTNGLAKKVKAHSAICAAFHGRRPEGMETAHWDGVRDNNLPGNLRWATSLENQADKGRHGTAACGERVGVSKLTEADVRAILASPLRPGLIADLCEVSRQTVHAIRSRKTWKQVEAVG